jgi:hypothetical protein
MTEGDSGSTTILAPVAGRARIDVLDILRGLAVLGILPTCGCAGSRPGRWSGHGGASLIAGDSRSCGSGSTGRWWSGRNASPERGRGPPAKPGVEGRPDKEITPPMAPSVTPSARHLPVPGRIM